MNLRKFRREPTEEEWEAAVAQIKVCRDLDRKPFRQKLERLARELEKLGREAHRVADRLEGLSIFAGARSSGAVSPSDYGYAAVMKRLKRWYENQLHFVRLQLFRLVGKPNLYRRGNLRRQAAALLDAAEFIDIELKQHKQRVREIRDRSPSGRSGKGRPPSTARRAIVLLLTKWNFTPTTLSDRLRKSGIAVEPENLKVASWLARR